MNTTKDFTKQLKKLESHVHNTKRYVEKRREASKEQLAKGNSSKSWKNQRQKRKV